MLLPRYGDNLYIVEQPYSIDKSMIIVEGMDNTGKSTLVRSLVADFHLEVRKTPGDVIGVPTRLVQWVEHELDQRPERPVIYDRFPLVSERVYGILLRGRCCIDTRFDNWIKWRHPLIIYCKPPIEMILNFGDRPQMDGVKEHAKLLLERYEGLMKHLSESGANLVKYDYTRPNAYGTVRTAVQLHVAQYMEGELKW